MKFQIELHVYKNKWLKLQYPKVWRTNRETTHASYGMIRLKSSAIYVQYSYSLLYILFLKYLEELFFLK